MSASARMLKVRLSSSSENTSKYEALTLGIGNPTAIWGVLPSTKCWVAGVPESTRLRRPPGMAFSPTEMDVAYHWPLSSSTDREPGTVSSESNSCVTLGFTDRNDERASDAFTYAWRKMAVSRSRRMNCRAVK